MNKNINIQKLKEWKEFLLAITKRTAEVIEPLIGTKLGGEEGTLGAGGDISLKIDLDAEETLMNELIKAPASFLLVTEERGYLFFDNEKKEFEKLENFNDKESAYYIIIDPIDGSTNAKRGIPFACISVALATGPNVKDIKIGVIYNIYTKDLYWAMENNGSWKNNKKIECTEIDKLTNTILIFALDHKRDLEKQIVKYNPILKYVKKSRIFGSFALNLALVAEGAVDLFLDYRDTLRSVDMAAGYMLVKEAGGYVIDKNGKSIDNLSLSLEHSNLSFVATNKKLKLSVENKLYK